MFPFLIICKGVALGLGLYLLRRWRASRWAVFTKTVDCSETIFVVTGATSGKQIFIVFGNMLAVFSANHSNVCHILFHASYDNSSLSLETVKGSTMFDLAENIKDAIYILVTGVGRATAEELASRGGQVILACRDVGQAKKVGDYLTKTYKRSRVIVQQVTLAFD